MGHAMVLALHEDERGGAPNATITGFQQEPRPCLPRSERRRSLATYVVVTACVAPHTDRTLMQRSMRCCVGRKITLWAVCTAERSTESRRCSTA